jgi:hypothetical protein
MNEEWRDILGWEGHYQVSSLGRVRRVKTHKKSAQGGVTKLEYGRINKQQLMRKGYLRVRVSIDGVLHSAAVHRLVAAAFIGDCPLGYQVNHKNGIKTDNRFENLEYVTQTENVRHSIEMGLRSHLIGEKGARAKLNNEQVREIKRLLLKNVLTNYQIGQMFGVSKDAISQINTGRCWDHINIGDNPLQYPLRKRVYK